MPHRIAAMLCLGMALAGCASSADGDLICADQGGDPMLRIGSSQPYRLVLAENGRGRELELQRWNVCFRCAGFPVLRLELKEVAADAADIRLGGDVRRCDGAGVEAAPQEHCIGGAGIQIGSRPPLRCAFPAGTTLGRLWAALTQAPLPEKTDPWWVLGRR